MMKRLSLLLILVGLVAVPLQAQTALSATTLAAAVSDSVTRTVSVASATGIVAPGTGLPAVMLVVDREVMRVLAVNGTVISVMRGADGSRASSHISGAPVVVAPVAAISSYIPSGQCTRTNLAYVPYVVGAGPGLGSEVGSLWDCLGVTANGQWVQTNGSAGFPILGSTVASPAGVLTPTGTVFKVSGTNAITGITLPAGATAGFTLAIEPTGIFTWTTATNIALAGTAVVGKILYFTWDGAKWVPSYIS